MSAAKATSDEQRATCGEALLQHRPAGEVTATRQARRKQVTVRFGGWARHGGDFTAESGRARETRRMSFRAKARSAGVEESRSSPVEGPRSRRSRFLDSGPSALRSE